MPEILVRNLDEAVVEQLETRAEIAADPCKPS